MELWIYVDCCAQIFYDTKPIAEILGLEKSEYEVSVNLNEDETRRYEEYLAAHEYWQARFKTEFDEGRNENLGRVY
jgi:hypothetical protein